ncbi:MAG: LysM peptidoglycan-binding domain-containing protein [Legionellales bacterium]|nr:LysM peptidoglycan-binding domain-containing protein [Legionellales bacterium]
MIKKRFCVVAMLVAAQLAIPQWAVASVISIKPNAPKVYTVEPGDTLIGIAARYLDDASDWPLLMKSNPQITNPYRLYPGEVLTLDNQNDPPQITVSEGGTIKLSPQIRSYPLNRPIPMIPLDVIKPFLNAALVINEDGFKSAPYVVAHANKYITTGAGDEIYVMGLPPATKRGTEFAIFREGGAYTDPTTKQVLGYSAINVGFAEVEKMGQPATLLVTETTREVLTGDNLLPSNRAQFSNDFYPSLPNGSIKGQIISVLDGTTQISQYQVVVIDRGRLNGLRVGNLLDVYQLGPANSNAKCNSMNR